MEPLMIVALVLVLTGLIFLFRRRGGPVLAMQVSWLVSLLPVASGAIEYDYLLYQSNFYIMVVGLGIAAFLFGAVIAEIVRPAPPVGPQRDHDWNADLARWLPFARVCCAIAIVSILAMLANIMSLGASIADLDIVREEYSTAET